MSEERPKRKAKAAFWGDCMTTKLLAQIEQLSRDGWCDAEIGRRLGIDTKTVQRWRSKAGLTPGKKGRAGGAGRAMYTFYLRTTGEYLCEGTVEECAAALGLQRCSMHNIISRTRKGALKKYEIYKVEEESNACE